jgi:hypothetical protein
MKFLYAMRRSQFRTMGIAHPLLSPMGPLPYNPFLEDQLPILFCHANLYSVTNIPVYYETRGRGTMLQVGRSRDRFPMRQMEFSITPNPSSRTMALGSTQPLTEMSTRNLPTGKVRTARKVDNLTAICEPTVLENVGTSTSQNTLDLHGPLQR